MTNVLVTGARSPAALELCRRLKQQGCRVVAADSLRFPLCRWTNAVDAFEKFEAPNASASRFADDLSAIILKHEIDFVIPTCEEVFHIAEQRTHLPDGPHYFLEDIRLLARLHDKFQFSQAMKAFRTVQVPESQLITNIDELPSCIQEKTINGKSFDDIVIKRVYSRFAEGTFIKPTVSDFQKIKASGPAHYVVQEYIKGPEFSCYAIANHGVLRALTIYHSRYRAGKGAGIYFSPVEAPGIEAFVKDFVETEKFHGQVSFDFMMNGDVDGVPYVLECNPRATSGIHLLKSETDWFDMLGIKKQSSTVWSADPKPRMVTLAMLTYGLVSCDRDYFANLRSGIDVISARRDRLPMAGQFVSMAELLAKSVIDGTSSLGASTADIEWNSND